MRKRKGSIDEKERKSNKISSIEFYFLLIVFSIANSKITNSAAPTNGLSFLTEEFAKEQSERLLGMARHHSKRKGAAASAVMATTTEPTLSS
jgi:hypothetical protein